jgi:hypothetical protein
MDNKILINAEIDVKALRDQLESATKIEDGEAFFETLAAVYKAKAEMDAAYDLLKSIETEAKGLINTKAKALYGNEWQAIKGERFKITRSRTGDVYAITGAPQKKFLKVKTSVDSKLVDAYVTTKGKLPAGIEINDQRGESIRVTING